MKVLIDQIIISTDRVLMIDNYFNTDSKSIKHRQFIAFLPTICLTLLTICINLLTKNYLYTDHTNQNTDQIICSHNKKPFFWIVKNIHY